MDELKERIKRHEGYVEGIYEDTLGFKTGGYGHKILPGEDIPTTQDGWELIFTQDFDKACMGATNLTKGMDVHHNAYKILVEMCFQMGENGVSKFKKMLACVEAQDHVGASDQMLDSRWAKQTPNRAKALSTLMSLIDA
tara:strand:+ start:209 stop:625 length:417 start_codon:yes stop_codon:yes gene_type:complete